MTIYAYEGTSRQITAVWPVGIGHAAEAVADAAQLSPQQVQELCHQLSCVSEHLWERYAHPAGAMDHDEVAELGRRDDVLASFQAIIPALHLPNLPDADGVLEISGVPVEDHAHALGRLLRAIPDRGVTEAVVVEVGREMRAVELAERGNLAGRAAQAVALDRLDISPVQVAAADRLLHANPLGSLPLLTSVDPAAACVATAHWLAAAATVAGTASGLATAHLFDESGPVVTPVSVPTLAAHAILAGGASPYPVVDQLLRQGIAAKHGRIPDLMVLLDDVAAARRQARRAPVEIRDKVLASLLPHRITPLDPTRPTRDLLETLLDGIRRCLVVFAQHVDGPQVVVERAGARSAGGTENPLTSVAEPSDPVFERFVLDVRSEATARHERLS